MAAKPQASNPPQLLDRVGRALDGYQARWAAIGALAVAYHGLIRASFDADALISLRGSEDLIALKLYAGGPKDLEDAEGVVRVQGDRLDPALLRKLCKGFGARAANACERILSKAGLA